MTLAVGTGPEERLVELHHFEQDWCNVESVKRLQIMIPVEMDLALEQRARVEGVSKAELVRRYVGQRLRPLPPLEEDPIWELIGIFDREGEETGVVGDSSSVDDVVYPK